MSICRASAQRIRNQNGGEIVRMTTIHLFYAAMGVTLCLFVGGVVLEIIEWHLNCTEVRRSGRKHKK